MGRPRRSVGAGSPPRRRGKGSGFSWQGMHQGITPAQAGKSSARFPHRTSARDHPRIGGEKAEFLPSRCLWKGSPPRGWGKDSLPDVDCIIRRITPHRRGKEQGAGGRMAAHGITPAWAGKRMRCHLGYGQSRDHPRAGGEKAYRQTVPGLGLGSPPRRRGKVDGPPAQVGRGRITPA